MSPSQFSPVVILKSVSSAMGKVEKLACSPRKVPWNLTCGGGAGRVAGGEGVRGMLW